MTSSDGDEEFALTEDELAVKMIMEGSFDDTPDEEQRAFEEKTLERLQNDRNGG